MKERAVRTAFIVLVSAVAAAHGFAQGESYIQLVAKAQSDLNAGNAAQALTESQQAIKAAPTRWEAYVVAGGALQMEHQYDKAVAEYSRAVENAPDAKKSAVRALLQKAVAEQASADTGSKSTPTSSNNSGTMGPSYAETTQYIRENVEKAGDTAMNSSVPDGSSTTQQRYSVSFDGCQTIVLSIGHYSSGRICDAKGCDTYTGHFQIDFHFPLATTNFWLPLSASDLDLELTSGEVSWSQRSFPDDNTGGTSKQGIEAANSTDPNKSWKDWLALTGDLRLYPDHGNPVMPIPFKFPGTEDIPPHLASAFQHLQDICKTNPAQAPKQPF